MNLLIVIAFATSAIFAASGEEFESLKLERWDSITPASEPPVEGKNQFYEGIFRYV